MWGKIQRLTLSEWCLLFEAVFALAGARLALARFRFRRIAADLGTMGVESALVISPMQNKMVRQIGWAVQVLARRAPWARHCLAQALAAHWMTRRRAIPGTVYLGVASDPEKPFTAHAWFRCGPTWVTGGDTRAAFQVLTRFGQSDQ
jgi:Transglutaminase-like superfamily